MAGKGTRHIETGLTTVIIPEDSFEEMVAELSAMREEDPAAFEKLSEAVRERDDRKAIDALMGTEEQAMDGK